MFVTKQGISVLDFDLKFEIWDSSNNFYLVFHF